MKVKDFLNWLKENDVNEDSEIEITRFLDNDIVANGNFFENDLNYDKDLRMVQIFDWGITMKVKELLKLINDNNIDGNTKIKIAKSVQDGIYSGYSESSCYDIKFYPESQYNEDDKLVFYIV